MPIIHCWSGPRSLSTCFLYSFDQRPDCTALDEPLYPHFLASRPELYRPYRDELLATHETDGNAVIRSFQALISETKPIVFAKHIGKFLINIDKKLLYTDNAIHIILVRDPLDMITSWSKKSDVHHEECSLNGTSLPQLLELFSDVRKATGIEPVVIDVVTKTIQKLQLILRQRRKISMFAHRTFSRIALN